MQTESSIVHLPRTVRARAIRILAEIRRYQVRDAPLYATKLRKKAAMDTHTFAAVFRWLQKHEYCRTTRTASRKLVRLASRGETAVPILRKRPRFGDLKRIVEKFQDARSAKKEADVLLELIVEAFDLAYSEFYEFGGARTEDYNWFRGGLEQRLREHLDKVIGDRVGVVHEVYLVIREIPCRLLLEDARLARERGHFLTQNHRYILYKMGHIKKEDLFDHNIRWSKNVMSFKPSGDELSQELMHRIDPWGIVEREWLERGAPATLGPETITSARNSYDYDDRWNPNVKELLASWNQTRKQRVIGGRE